MSVARPTSKRPSSSKPPQVRFAPPQLQHAFERFRSRLLMVRGLSAACIAVIAFFAVLIMWMWVDLALDLPPVLRLLAWGIAFATLIILGVRSIRRISAEANDKKIAARLDDVGQTGGQIRSGFDLWESQRRSNRSRRRSPATVVDEERQQLAQGLSSLAVITARRLIAQAKAEEAVPADPLMKSSGYLLGMGLAILIGVIVWPRMAWTELTRFFDPFGDHPAYTSFGFVVTPNAPEVRYGESLDLSVEVLGKVTDQLELVLIPAAAARTELADEVEPIDVLPMFSDPSGVWQASIADITAPFDFFIRVRRDRSETYPVKVITVPEILGVQAEITPPLYTGLLPYRGRLPVAGIEGLPGTHVKLTATSNRPLSVGEMKLADAAGGITSTVQMLVAHDPHEVMGEFVLTHAGKFELDVADIDSQPSAEPLSAPMELMDDHHPIVRLTQPKAISLATPTAMLPVVVAAEDDYGVQTCELFRSLNDSRFLSQSLEMPAGMPTRVRVQTILPLSEYELQPGDEIKLFARTTDNDPNASAEGVGKGSESAISVVRIISQTEFEQMQQQRAGMEMLMSKYRQAQRRLENLAAQIRELQEKLQSEDRDSPLSEQMQKQLQNLTEQMQKEADALQKLSESSLPFDVDQQLSPQMNEMAEKIQQLAEQARQMSQNQELTPEQLESQLQQMLEQLQNQQQQNQQDAMRPLEALEKVLPLKQDEGEFVQLVQRQRQLAERLNSFKDFDGDDDSATKARIRELEEEQRRIREDLNRLVDKIEEDLTKLPVEEEFRELLESAEDFVMQLHGSGASEEMSSAEEALAQLQGGRGHESAERAAELLEQFLSQCKNMGNQAGQCLPKFSPTLGQSLQQTLNQLTKGLGSGMQQGGMGLGQGGTGGFSSTSNNLNNIGMYGSLPYLDPSLSSGGMSDTTNQQGVIPYAVGADGAIDASEFEASQSNPTLGTAEWSVPLRYRRPAGRYLQQIAEELEE